MTLDDITYTYRIRDADNRVAVVLFVRAAYDLWYTSIEVLTKQNENAPWECVPASVRGSTGEADARARAQRLYDGEWKEHISAIRCMRLKIPFLSEEPKVPA